MTDDDLPKKYASMADFQLVELSIRVLDLLPSAVDALDAELIKRGFEDEVVQLRNRLREREAEVALGAKTEAEELSAPTATAEASYTDPDVPTWTCTNCGTKVEKQFYSCWKCSHPSGREMPAETEWVANVSSSGPDEAASNSETAKSVTTTPRRTTLSFALFVMFFVKICMYICGYRLRPAGMLLVFGFTYIVVKLNEKVAEKE